MVRGETDEEAHNLMTRQCMARYVARQLRGTFFIEPNDEEFKLTMKAARRKLEVPMPAAMPCKIQIKSSGETHRKIGKRKKEYRKGIMKITSLQKE